MTNHRRSRRLCAMMLAAPLILCIAVAARAAEEEDSPRALFDAFGIPAERFVAHPDGAPLESDPPGVDLLLRLLFRMDAISLGSIERWSRPTEDLAPLAAKGDPELRGTFLRVAGRIERVQRVRLSEGDAERFTFDTYYRCAVVLGSAETPAVVYTRHLPREWRAVEKLSEPIALDGLYLGRGAPVGSRDALIFVAPRIAWRPETFLGSLGMDVGLLDTVGDGRSLTESERECFYQALSAVDRAGKVEMLRNARRENRQRRDELAERRGELTAKQQELDAALAAAPRGSEKYQNLRKDLYKLRGELERMNLQFARLNTDASELVPLLESPHAERGKLKLLRGTTRRVLEIKVTDEETRERFGLDHYYQIDAEVGLEYPVRLEIAKRTASGKFITEKIVVDSHPVTFCVRRLPPGLPTGDDVSEPIAVPGFFLKNWAYDTEGLEADTPRRVTPMLIAREPYWIQPQEEEGYSLVGITAGVLIATVIAALWLVIWWLARSDRSFHNATLARTYALDAGVSLNELGLEVTSGPDFRNHGKEAERPPSAEEGHPTVEETGDRRDESTATGQVASPSAERPAD